MKTKTSELSGPALDWAVGRCILGGGVSIHKGFIYANTDDPQIRGCRWHPSNNWLLGGPILEREGIVIFPASEIFEKFWCAAHYACGAQSFELDDLCGKPAYVFTESEVMMGPTPLVAAMRCIVASKLGDEVEIPDEVAS